MKRQLTAAAVLSKHVLDLAGELALTAEQRMRTQALFASMQAKILTSEQRAHYLRLRGYRASGAHHAH